MNEISRKILCVDDDALLLEGLKRNLRKKFDLTFASGGEEGLTVLREHGPFAVVVSDYRMPGMNGVEFLRATRALSPETVLVMLTGEAELSVAVSALHEGHIFRFLNKPCPPQLLEITLRDSIEQHRLTVNERLLREELDQANEELRLLNDGLERQVERRTEMIEGLYRLVSDLNGLDSLDEVAQCVVSRTADLLHSRRVALLLPDPAAGFCPSRRPPAWTACPSSRCASSSVSRWRAWSTSSR
jgi:CheY-like chemotaxis protein